MGFYFAKPSTVLSPYVKQYWGIENCMNPGEEHIQRIIPNGLMELTFYLGVRPQLLNHHQKTIENTVVSGHCKGHHDLMVTGNLLLFSVSFKPQGAWMFFDLPMNELYNCIVPVRYLLKEEIGKLEEELHEAIEFQDKVILVEAFLVALLKKKTNFYHEKRMVDSIGLISRKRGIVEVDTLALRACLSRKQYERMFQECVGTSPKQFMRVVRFQHSLHFRRMNSQLRLTDLAYECGFFDQSHMINEYRDLSGKTPSQYFAECEPYSDYFAE